MNTPYELAKAILQSTSAKKQSESENNRFTSIDLYGSAVHEQTANDDICNHFHLKNESGEGGYYIISGVPGNRTCL